MRVLLIESDEHFARSLEKDIEKNGYSVDCEIDGLLGQERAVAFDYDLIILDIACSRINGSSVCQYVRKRGVGTPILMLCTKYQDGNGILGLDCGADDCLMKPFCIFELHARIRALIRRSHGHPSTEITIGNLCINTLKKTVCYSKKEISLTSKEYQMLEYLALNKNGIITRKMLEDHVWGSENNLYSNVPEVIISRIRKKIDPSNKEAVIKTIKGLGYVIKD